MGVMYDVLETLRADPEGQEENIRQLLRQLTDPAGHAREEKKQTEKPEDRERSVN